MWSKSKSLILSKVLTLIFCGFLTVAVFALPSFVDYYIMYTGKDAGLYSILLITLYISVVPAYTLLICLFMLLLNIGNNRVFINQNVKLLRIISWCCYAIALIYAFYTFNYIFASLITITAAFFGIIIRVIKNIFEQAIEIKSENDLTI